MLTRFRVLFLVFLASLLSACGTDPGFDKFAEAPSGGLRVLNAIPDAPPLFVEYGTQSLGNIPFGDASGVQNVIPGLERTTKVSYAVGRELQTVAETTLLVPQDQLITVVLTGTLDNVQFLTLEEDTSLPADDATTTDLIFVNATSNPAPIQIDLVDGAQAATIFSSTLSAGATTNALAVPESTELSITTYNADTDQLIWQSGDFGAAAGLRPIIVLVDHFGPSPEHRGLYVTPIGLFPFANESLPSALSFMHLIPDRTSIDIYSRAVSNSNPFAVFVDIDQSAEAGSYEISIAQLATTPRYRINEEFESADVELGTGELSITNGDQTTTVTIASGNNTLTNLVTQINTSGASVTAEIVTLENNNVHFVISPQDRGPETSLLITTEDADEQNEDAEGLSRLASNNLVIETDAITAQFTVNGTDYERSSNQVADVIDGATLFLGLTTGESTVTFEISEQELRAGNLSYLSRSEPVSAVEGTAIFYITPPGEPTNILHQENLSVQPGAYQLVSASGIGEDLDLGLAADPRRPITGHVVTSVIHGAPSTPILDFYVLQSGRSISDFTPSGNDVPLLAAGFYNLTGLTFELTVAESDSNTVLAGPLSIDTTVEGIKRLLIIDADGGGTPPQLILQDAVN